MPATDAPMPLVAESADIAGAPAAAVPAGLPANDQWQRRIRATEMSAQWLQVPYGSMPYGRPLRTRRPRTQRARSGAIAISE
eukprot:1993605-Pyramimonas_sp.AAC.1